MRRIPDTRVPKEMQQGRRTRASDKDTRKFLGSKRWKVLVASILAADPLCQSCKAKGKTVLADEVDHIKPRAEYPDLMWDKNNLQGLCRSCHIEKTRQENANTYDETIDPWHAFRKEMESW